METIQAPIKLKIMNCIFLNNKMAEADRDERCDELPSDELEDYVLVTILT